MSKEEKKFLKQELWSLRMEDISSFMESLPPEFLSILRIDGLLRSISSKLGASRRMLLLAYAKYAVYGLARHANIENDHYGLSTFRAHMTYLRLRVYIEIFASLLKIEELTHSFVVKLMRTLHEAAECVCWFLFSLLRPIGST